MIFKSDWAKSKRSEKELFEYISDMNNLPPVLPEQVVNVTADTDNLSFTIQGMGSIALRVTKREPNKLIQLAPVGKTPFQFVLNVYVKVNESTSQRVNKSESVSVSESESKSECCFEIDAQLNPLMQMMASRPLQNLVNMMASRVEML